MTRKNEHAKTIQRLQSLKNIGPVTAKKLYSIGIKTPSQLKQADPKKLYGKLRKKSGGKLDKCVLYQLQGAILDIPWPECKDIIESLDISFDS